MVKPEDALDSEKPDTGGQTAVVICTRIVVVTSDQLSCFHKGPLDWLWITYSLARAALVIVAKRLNRSMVHSLWRLDAQVTGERSNRDGSKDIKDQVGAVSEYRKDFRSTLPLVGAGSGADLENGCRHSVDEQYKVLEMT